MRIDHFGDWHRTGRLQTDPADNPSKNYAGIAIGPGAEGKVLVDGVLLQAGRVHPVRQNKYTIEKVRPLTPVAGFPTEDFALDSINDLSLIVFEDPCELGACIARPNGIYGDTIANSSGEGPTLVLRYPFVGRRNSLVVLYSPNLGAGAFDLNVQGGRWQNAAGKIVRYPLHVAAAVHLDPTDDTYAFYIGGFDNEECWDFIEVFIDDGGGFAWKSEAETIGEIGAW